MSEISIDENKFMTAPEGSPSAVIRRLLGRFRAYHVNVSMVRLAPTVVTGKRRAMWQSRFVGSPAAETFATAVAGCAKIADFPVQCNLTLIDQTYLGVSGDWGR